MIIAEALTKTYGTVRVVDDVSFSALPGRVTGFLGPNGAGKTTTLRMMVGLTTPTSGTATFDGSRYADLPNPGREVGVLIDATAMPAGRTGREALALVAMTIGASPTRVQEMLNLVGLHDEEADRRIRTYSLGMKQRLAIGAALIGDPEMLVLDEPSTGLDPAGMRWLRTMLKTFAGAGRTVLLSSHLLREIEAIADDIVVISEGRVVAAGGMSELAARAGTRVKTPESSRFAQALIARGFTVERLPDDSLRIDADATTVGRVASQANVQLTELAAGDSDLESTFLELTSSGRARDRSA